MALHTPVRSERLGYATLALHAPGVAAFVAGLVPGVHALVLAGAALFATGLLLFLGNPGAG